ncbi:MAG: periplasmic heavy metal sensor [Pseudomonadota bacterium]
MTDATASEPRRRSPLWMRALLVVSLSVNLAFVGVVVGQSIRMQTQEARIKGLDRWQARLLTMVPEPRRDEAKSLMLAELDLFREARAQMAESRVRTIAAVRREPFEPQELAAALQARVSEMNRLSDLRHRQMLEIASKLNAEERELFAEGMERAIRRWRPKSAAR